MIDNTKKRRKRILLKDVANAVGVSTSLVSIVLNNKAKEYRIGEEVAQRVLLAAKKLNYTPNLVARNLRGGKTQLIGLIVTDISNPFFSLLSRLIEDHVDEIGYTVVFGSSDENVGNTKKLVDVFLNKGVDGIIVVPCDGSEKIIEELHESNIPLVLVDRYFPNLDVSFSCLNNIKAMELATRHLIDQGFERISLIAYKSEMKNMADRIAGYEKTMLNAGVKKHIQVKQVGFSNPQPEVYKALDFLVNKKKTEAVIFSTNALSVCGLYSLNEMNKHIPEDVAIVGFDENDVFDLFYTPITYVKQPIAKIAEESVNILIDKIKNGEQAKKSMVLLEPELVIQKSSLKIMVNETNMFCKYIG